MAFSRSATNNESRVANLRYRNYVQFVGTVRLVGITEAVDAVILQIEVAGRRVNGKPGPLRRPVAMRVRFVPVTLPPRSVSVTL